MSATLWYVHDPMCSWCYAFRPILAVLQERLPGQVALRRLLGGLAADTSEPMPEVMRAYIQATWQRIEERVPGTHFNYDFWDRCEPRRTTYPACRAVIAARRLAPTLEVPMIEAIQDAYYRHARNPSDEETLVGLAGGLGLDTLAFARELQARSTRSQLQEEVAQARAIGVGSFPALILDMDGSRWPIPVAYTDSAPMVETIEDLLAA